MKDLFVLFYPITPHLETDLELIKKSIENKNEIRILMCGGELKMCLYNFTHKKSSCKICQSRIKNGLKQLGIQRDQLIYLDFSKLEPPKLPDLFITPEALLDFTYEGKKIGLIASATLIHKINRDPGFDPKKNVKLVRIGLENVIALYDFIHKLLIDEKIDNVYFFNGRFSIFRVIREVCVALNVAYYCHERTLRLNYYTLRKNTLPHDYHVIWDEIIKIWDNSGEVNKEEIGAQWFLSRRSGNDKNSFTYTDKQHKDLLPIQLDPTKKIISIFNSTMEEYYTVDEFPKTRIYRDELDAMNKICKDLSEDSSLLIFIRIHPNLMHTDNLQTRFYRELKEKYINIYIIAPEDPISTYSLIDHSNIVITFGSTVGIEATFWKKPSITTFITNFDILDVGYKPNSHGDLLKMVKTSLQPKSYEESLKFGYWAVRSGIKYEYFYQNTLLSGKFLGVELKPSLYAVLIASIFRLLEIRSFTELKENLKKLKNRLLTK